jgi:hypothetical protein
MLDLIEIAAAVMILGAYAANQIGRAGPEHLAYQIANLVGGTVLAAIAAYEHRPGFLLLESVWALASLVAGARLLAHRARR